MRSHALAFGVLATIVVGCGDAGFGGDAKKAAADKPKPSADAKIDESSADTGVRIDGKRVLRATEEFNGAPKSSPIDMVWIIDNSGSMADKIAQVKANFNAFTKAISGQADLKLAVITEFCKGGLGLLCLDTAGVETKMERIDLNVGSYNELAILAAAQSPEGSVSVPGLLGGGLSINKSAITRPETHGGFTGFLEAPNQILASTGRLRSFFREGAAKVTVVVSDEDDFALGADEYQRVMGTLGGGYEAYKLFGFINTTGEIGGLGGLPTASGACTGMKSVAYPKLAKATGGAVYDICKPDWTETFDKLTKAVLEGAKAQYALKHVVHKLLEVDLNGKQLESKDYHLDGDAVVLAPELLNDTVKLVVSYEYLEG